MTSQDNLPVWAKILLGVSLNEAELSNHSAMDQPEGSCNRDAHQSEPTIAEQNIVVFDAGKHPRKWNWKSALCPSAGEAN
jgi:hypothetical protein